MAKQMLKSLENVDSDFKTHHLALIDLLEEEEDLEREQQVLDEHDEIVTALFARINSHLFSNCQCGTRTPQGGVQTFGSSEEKPHLCWY